MFRRAAYTLLLGCSVAACGSDPIEPDDGGGTPNDPARPPDVVAEAIGRGDGSPSSVRLVPVFGPERVVDAGEEHLLMPTALDWNPAGDSELWITLVEQAVEAPCTPTDAAGCNALEGRMGIVQAATGAAPTAEIVLDGNGWHFMRHSMGIAFGSEGRKQLLATCGDARTANYTDEEIPYNGPVLWDADPAIFGGEPMPPTSSTHVDMLHATPYCMGIAHEQANVYWVVNGDVGAFDRYDFNLPHQPGGDDHSDGEVWRYGEGELLRVAGVPSGMAYDSRRKTLYVSDSGHGRVVALDTTSGFADGDITVYETIPTHLRMSGAVVSEIASGFDTPSGLTLEEDVLFVTDHATGRIVAMDRSGAVLRELDTGLAANALTSISIGPDDMAYITDVESGTVFRIEPL